MEQAENQVTKYTPSPSSGMIPLHTLSEILTRRHRVLANSLPRLAHDYKVAALEEIASIEWHLKQVEDAGRSERFGGLFETIKGITREYDAKLAG